MNLSTFKAFSNLILLKTSNQFMQRVFQHEKGKNHTYKYPCALCNLQHNLVHKENNLIKKAT